MNGSRYELTEKPGYIDGAHYTEYVDRINDLKRAGKTDDAIALLLKCVDATESEDRVNQWGVAPGYYEQLAILYRKEKRHREEVSILERFSQQRKAPGALPPKLETRLIKAKQLLAKNQSH